VAYILEDSETEIVFVENRAQLDKVLRMRDRLPKLRRAIVIEPYSTRMRSSATSPRSWSAVARRSTGGRSRPAGRAWTPRKVATLIYTSGTTGNPKGVMLCHRNLVSNIDGVTDFLEVKPGETDLQFLPMCHSFGRMEVLGLMMYQGTICFAESIEKLP